MIVISNILLGLTALWVVVMVGKLFIPSWPGVTGRDLWLVFFLVALAVVARVIPILDKMQ